MKFYAVSGIAVLAAAALSISMIIGSGKNLAANINSSTVEEKTESNILVLYFTRAENAEFAPGLRLLRRACSRFGGGHERAGRLHRADRGLLRPRPAPGHVPRHQERRRHADLRLQEP